MTQPNRPIAFEAYERLAKAYSHAGETKFHNAWIDRPCLLAAAGDVGGLEVLDAGCGPGFYARALLDAGAKKVVGVDASPRMIDEARKRAPDAEFQVADLDDGLGQFAPACFDLILSGLAIDYVRDWRGLFREFHRVLRPGGVLVYSVQHPIGSYLWYKLDSYAGVQRAEAAWKGFTPEPIIVPDHYRGMEELFMPAIEAGFALELVRDSVPPPEAAAIDPAEFADCMQRPPFLVCRWKRNQ